METNDLDLALESFGNEAGPWRRFMKDEEAVKEYTNVEIIGIAVKRYCKPRLLIRGAQKYVLAILFLTTKPPLYSFRNH